MATTIYNQISANKLKTWIIILLFIVLFVAFALVAGYALDYGLSLVGIALIISGIMTFISYYNSDKIVLSMAHAKLADKAAFRTLYTTVENLSIGSGLPIPKVYVIEDPSPNAFATGRDPKHAAVAATTGLLAKLNKQELEGVIAHELSHIGNYDIRVMGVVAILVGSIAILADIFIRSLWFSGGRSDRRSGGNAIFLIIGLVFAILAPIAATIIQLAISRKREFLADASGALLTRYPEGLASALSKIASDPHKLKHANKATAHFYIENPDKADVKGTHGNWLTNLFSTHPPVADRIKILRAM